MTLHEARHTYASFLMAAGYNLKQIQEYLGHADLVTTGRYIKNLPVPRGTTAREKLEAYLAAEIGHLEPEMWTGIWTGLVSAAAICRGSSGTDAPGLYRPTPSLHFQGFARLADMPEEGLEPPTRGL